MKHYVLIYDFVADYVERRAAFRSEHLQMAWEACDRGELLLGGALSDPVDTGLLLFRSETPEAAEAFARADPYVVNGLVKGLRVREWTTVVGEQSANPLR